MVKNKSISKAYFDPKGISYCSTASILLQLALVLVPLQAISAAPELIKSDQPASPKSAGKTSLADQEQRLKDAETKLLQQERELLLVAQQKPATAIPDPVEIPAPPTEPTNAEAIKDQLVAKTLNDLKDQEPTVQQIIPVTPAVAPTTPQHENTAESSLVAAVKDRVEQDKKSSPVQANQIEGLRKKNAELLSALNEAKMRLMIAETQVEKLSSIIESRGGRIAEPRMNIPMQQPQLPSRSQPPRARINNQAVELDQLDNSSRNSFDLRNRLPANVRSQPQVTDVAPNAQSDGEMPIATVASEKASLYTSPGEGASPLMTLERGTKLAVETVQGGWYRVITPTGSRAWIAANSIAFGPTGSISPLSPSSSSIPSRQSPPPSRSSDAAVERAFDLIKSGKK